MSNTSTSEKAHDQEGDAPPATLLSRILSAVFPKVPDFFVLLNDQCDVMAQTMEALLAYMETGDEQKASLVRELEKQGDQIKARNFAILADAFATPLDREDIYRAITSIDMIQNYAKTTVRGISNLQLAPDQHMLKMVQVMKEGTDAVCRGFSKLSHDPLGTVDEEKAIRLSVTRLEECFREAKGALFVRCGSGAAPSDSQEEEVVARLMTQTIEMFKYREVYQHLLNMGNHMSTAGQVLYDIMVQV